MSSADDWRDAVVVGAGHNGLVATAYLARAGYRVLVCERAERVGGAAITGEIVPGFRCSTASYALSLLRPEVWRELDLAARGVEAVPKDPQIFVPLTGGGFFVWRHAARTADELRRLSPHDADAYPKWCAFLEEAVRLLRPVVDAVEPIEPEAYLAARGREDVWRLAVAGSAAEFVATFFDNPAVQAAFASQGIIGTNRSVYDDGTAWVLTYHALGGEIYGSTGTWGFVRGGMGSLTEALATSARAAGAEIRCSAPVEEILVEGGRARGVRVEGRVVRARAVLAACGPRTAFLRLLPAGAVETAFLERVRSFEMEGCVLKLNLALGELPNFAARPGSGPQHFATVEIAPSLDDLDIAWREAQAAGHSSHPFMEVFCASAVDPSLVDGEGAVVSVFAQYAGPGYDLDRASAAVVETLGTYAPNLPGAVIGLEAFGPRELEARFALDGGHIFHGEITPNQSFGRRFDYRTPLPGLYLCGSGARPGGGVMGAAGRNAARIVLADLAQDATRRD